MKNLLSLIRNGLGQVMVWMERLTRPEPIERSAENQREVEEQLDNMALYQFQGCPFCIKVRRVVHRLNLPLEMRDAQNNSKYRAELEEGGGTVQVPCLRIDRSDGTEWLYESDDIIEFLEEHFSEPE